VAGDLHAFSIQQAGRLDYTAVVKQSDGHEVWSCEHITHHNPISAMDGANREIARRTAPEKHSQK
jgi:VCBS repeat-containing protein